MLLATSELACVLDAARWAGGVGAKGRLYRVGPTWERERERLLCPTTGLLIICALEPVTPKAKKATGDTGMQVLWQVTRLTS